MQPTAAPPADPARTVLTDGVVVLRPWRATDVPAVFRACQDLAIQRWTTVPSPYAESDAEHFVTRLAPAGWADGSEFTFAVEADGGLVASIGLVRRVSRVTGATGEVGYWAAPEARGRGYMTRAVRLVCAWGFATFGLGRIGWHAEVGNGPSRAVAERAGFRIEGVMRAALDRPGGRADAWQGALLPGEPLEGRPVEPVHPATLPTDRLLLRPVRAGDAAAIAAGCQDPELQRRLPLPVPYTRAHAEEFVRRQAGAPWDGEAHHAIVERSSDRLVGVIGLDDIRRTIGRAEVGYWIAADARGRGYAGEALDALCAWAFGELGLHRVTLLADVTNAASCRTAERAGFRREGVLAGHVVGRDGARCDVAAYARLAGVR